MTNVNFIRTVQLFLRIRADSEKNHQPEAYHGNENRPIEPFDIMNLVTWDFYLKRMALQTRDRYRTMPWDNL